MPFLNRIKAVATTLDVCDALIVDDPIDLYYLTGQTLSLGRLIIHKHLHPVLLIDGRYFQQCKEEASLEVVLWDFTSKMPLEVPKCVGFDAEVTTYSQFQRLQTLLSSTLIPLKAPIAMHRMIKDAEEIKRMEAAATLCSRGYAHGIQQLRVGKREQDVAWEIEKFWKEEGGEQLSFDPIIAFGANSSKPHYRASATRLKRGDIVLMDLGVRLHHYHSDMTRVVCFGSPTDEIVVIYEIVYDALMLGLRHCLPGVAVGEVDRIVREHIEHHGYPFVHSLGHGVGLQIHEFPRLRTGALGSEIVLQEGMVITVEPGIYLPGIGGIRLEQEIVITSDGYRYLTLAPLSPKLLLIDHD